MKTLHESALLTSALAIAAAMPAMADTTFNRIASFAMPGNMAVDEDRGREASAEVISVSEDGNTLVYSDSPLGVLGFLDITDAGAPKPLGNAAMEGEPTTAVIIGRRGRHLDLVRRTFGATAGPRPGQPRGRAVLRPGRPARLGPPRPRTAASWSSFRCVTERWIATACSGSS
nr:hypothetical protein [Paracoccus beibuensis]